MPENRGILETVLNAEQHSALRNFNPQGAVLKHLEKLATREAQVLTLRHGLADGIPQTLETIGKHLGLTRERIRQIEKEATKRALALAFHEELDKNIDLIFQIIEGHGNIIRERELLSILLPQGSVSQQQAVLFILYLAPKFNPMPEAAETHRSWFLTGFDNDVFDQVVENAVRLLNSESVPEQGALLFKKIKEHDPELSSISDTALESMLSVSKKVANNPFDEWGAADSAEINPRDVGDKAYLVLKHNGKPEHYSNITELINKQGFDSRVAHKETVHNELIKNERFVLIGRGIYALREWGYQPGVVVDVIAGILRKAGKALSRDEITDQVMRQRMVKKNTVLVALSNRQRFKKTEDNKYTNA